MISNVCRLLSGVKRSEDEHEDEEMVENRLFGVLTSNSNSDRIRARSASSSCFRRRYIDLANLRIVTALTVRVNSSSSESELG